jgi:small subunit ribosomal protein S7
MSRRHSAEKREVLPDPKFGDLVIAKFTNSLMYQGKKSAAEHILYDALAMIEKKTGQNPLKAFHDAVDNVKPSVEVRSRRVGGATYQVPVEIKPERRTALAIRWLLGFAAARPDHTMAEKLAAEMIAASKNEGAAIKKREDTHRMAEANKAFAHYRW